MLLRGVCWPERAKEICTLFQLLSDQGDSLTTLIDHHLLSSVRHWLFCWKLRWMCSSQKTTDHLRSLPERKASSFYFDEFQDRNRCVVHTTHQSQRCSVNKTADNSCMLGSIKQIITSWVQHSFESMTSQQTRKCNNCEKKVRAM